MNTTWRLYADARLTIPLAGLSATFSDGSAAPVQRQAYLGTRTPGRRLVPLAPADNIQLIASGPGATAIRLSTSAAGLADAVPGAPLDLPLENGDAIVATVPLYIQCDAIDAPADVVLTLSAMEQTYGPD